MAKSIHDAYSGEKRDELCTPRILVDVLKPYWEVWVEDREAITDILGVTASIPTVWLPFDTKDSEFYYFFYEQHNCNIITSHVSEGKDFFEYEPPEWDIAISNPPFSRKLDVFKRLNSFGKPYAMVMNTMALNYMEIGNYFADNPVQMLIPDKRISFDGNPSSFNSGYVCRNFLPCDLLFHHVEHCNSGDDFIPSRMWKGAE